MKVIRDCVHGDLEFSPEEMRIIHTAGFQRLHGFRQLGLTYLVYPGAKHSRFEHVLGVTHLAAEIAKSLRAKGDFFIDKKGRDLPTPEEIFKILRFAALLHDMGHLPFGHTFEDEMPIIPKHDSFEEEATAPEKKREATGSDKKEKPTCPRMEGAVREVLAESGNEKYTEAVLQVLLAISKSKSDEKLYDLVEKGKVRPEYLVLADIIGNTLCADLLDYIIRDHMMTGIRGAYDQRIFRYFGVEKHAWNGKTYNRVVIRLVKNGRFRKDALGDLLDILKLRYNLSDKVLFHPQKCSADSMLINTALRNGFDEQKLMQYSDDALLYELRNDPVGIMIRDRKLFKPVFVCDLDQVSTFQKKVKEEIILEVHQNTENVRANMEKEIERRLGLPQGQTSVLIFCPRPDMTLKPVLTFVQWKDGATRRLNQIKEEDDQMVYKQINVLEKIYPRLWRLYLFVRPDLRFQGHKIASVFKDVLKETTHLTVTCDPAFENYLEDPEGCWDYWAGRNLEKELETREEYRRCEDGEKQAVTGRCWVDLRGPEYSKFDERFVEAGKPIGYKSNDEWLKSIPLVVDKQLRKARNEEAGSGEGGYG